MRFIAFHKLSMETLTVLIGQVLQVVDKVLSVVKAWVGLTTAQIAHAVHIYRNGCTRHRMSCNCGLFLHVTVSTVVVFSRIVNRLEKERLRVSLSKVGYKRR